MRPPISRSSRRPRPGWRFGQSWRETGTHDEPHAPGASEIVPTATDPPPVPPTGVPRPGPQPETAPGEATGPESPGWIPGGTYRLQFHKEFTLGDARGLLPYLKALGITLTPGGPSAKTAQAAPKLDPNSAAYRKALAEDLADAVDQLSRMNKRGAPLAEVMDHLAKLALVNLHLDPRGLAAEGVTTETPVTINLSAPNSLKSP